MHGKTTVNAILYTIVRVNCDLNAHGFSHFIEEIIIHNKGSVKLDICKENSIQQIIQLTTLRLSRRTRQR